MVRRDRLRGSVAVVLPCHLQVGLVVLGMIKASREYDTQVAIAADCPQDIELDAFHRVIKRFSKDIKDTKKGGNRRPQIEPFFVN